MTHMIVSDNLKISVALTVFNESSNIKDVIGSLLAQTRKPDEIVVCDGGSKDDTVAQLNKFAEEGAPLKVLVEKGACRGAGRNRAIKAAAHSFIALTDAGTIADPKWLECLVSLYLKNPSLEVVYGTVMPQVKDRFSRCLAALIVATSQVSGRLCPSITSLLLRKNVWEKADGFPEGLTTMEDLIFLDRIKAGGASSDIAADAVVYWSLSQSLSGLFRRLSTYSRGSLSAGFANRWHYGTLRNCCIFALMILGGVFLNPWIFIGVPFFQAMRVHKYLSRIPWMRTNKFFEILNNYAASFVILATMDSATLNGLAQWVAQDHCRKDKTKNISRD